MRYRPYPTNLDMGMNDMVDSYMCTLYYHPVSNFKLPASQAFTRAMESTKLIQEITGVPDIWSLTTTEQQFINYVEKAIEWLEDQTVEVNIFGVSVELTWNNEWTVVFDSATYETSQWDDHLIPKEIYFLANVMEKALWFIAQHYPKPIPKPEPTPLTDEMLQRALDDLQTNSYTPTIGGTPIDGKEWEKMLWGSHEYRTPEVKKQHYEELLRQRANNSAVKSSTIYAQQAQNYALGLGNTRGGVHTSAAQRSKDDMLKEFSKRYDGHNDVKIFHEEFKLNKLMEDAKNHIPGITGV